MEITRVNFEVQGDTTFPVEDPKGAYVAYEDHAAMVAEIDLLRRELQIASDAQS